MAAQNCIGHNIRKYPLLDAWAKTTTNHSQNVRFIRSDTENIKLVFCAVKDTIMQAALKESNLV